jgi:hypothetical protein
MAFFLRRIEDKKTQDSILNVRNLLNQAHEKRVEGIEQSKVDLCSGTLEATETTLRFQNGNGDEVTFLQTDEYDIHSFGSSTLSFKFSDAHGSGLYGRVHRHFWGEVYLSLYPGLILTKDDLTKFRQELVDPIQQELKSAMEHLQGHNFFKLG